MDGGALLAPKRGGSLEKPVERFLSMSYAFISLKPGLWSPLTVDAKEESSREASWAWQNGHTVSSGRA